MLDSSFFELTLDNIPHGIYILDDGGNYVYANSTYINTLGLSKHELLSMNVHDFVKKKEINICISDIVYRQKRRISVIQDVYINEGLNYKKFQQLITSTPIFAADGKVQNIIAICTPLEHLNGLYDEADKNGNVSTLFRNQAYENNKTSIIAESEDMRQLLKIAELVAKTDTSVLISGESGTGKEVIAQYIHQQSRRTNAKLVVINCASLPENLLEAELFGYESGAFTGAAAGGKKGLIEEADGGTLFLDEINSLPFSLQGKLLRALETKTIQRLGSTKQRKVDFRILSATNENLDIAIKEKRFRLDLYYRLNIVPLYILPLRDRKKDILPLAKSFLEFYNKRYEKNKRFTEETLRKMENYEWPGNVRELKNFVERTVVMSAGIYIEVPDIGNITSNGVTQQETVFNENRIQEEKEKQRLVYEKEEEQYFGEGIPLEVYLSECEKKYVKYALEKYRSTYAAAEFLGVSQSAVMRKKKKYQL